MMASSLTYSQHKIFSKDLFMEGIEKLKHVAVIGGGRWAKEILGALDNILPAGVHLTVHSRRNSLNMKLWTDSYLSKRAIVVNDKWPVFNEPSRCAMIIANAASEHEVATVIGLLSRVPVLVEKPLALSAESVNRLISLANEKGSALAAGHVFRFAEYLKNFTIVVNSLGGLKSLEVIWKDPSAEIRLGKLKSYDSSIPVFVDCLPHALSLLSPFLSIDQPLLEGVQFKHGGAEVKIYLKLNNISVCISLARDAPKRQRLIWVNMLNGSRAALDFHREPGLILSSRGEVIADPDWEIRTPPLTQMLAAFISGVCDGEWDTRLSPVFALNVAKLTDQVRSCYSPQLRIWVKTMLSDNTHGLEQESLIYGLRELLQEKHRLSESLLKHRVNKILKTRIFD